MGSPFLMMRMRLLANQESHKLSFFPTQKSQDPDRIQNHERETQVEEILEIDDPASNPLMDSMIIEKILSYFRPQERLSLRSTCSSWNYEILRSISLSLLDSPLFLTIHLNAAEDIRSHFPHHHRFSSSFSLSSSFSFPLFRAFALSLHLPLDLLPHPHLQKLFFTHFRSLTVLHLQLQSAPTASSLPSLYLLLRCLPSILTLNLSLLLQPQDAHKNRSIDVLESLFTTTTSTPPSPSSLRHLKGLKRGSWALQLRSLTLRMRTPLTLKSPCVPLPLLFHNFHARELSTYLQQCVGLKHLEFNGWPGPLPKILREGKVQSTLEQLVIKGRLLGDNDITLLSMMKWPRLGKVQFTSVDRNVREEIIQEFQNSCRKGANCEIVMVPIYGNF